MKRSKEWISQIKVLYRHYLVTSSILRKVLNDPLSLDQSRSILRSRIENRTNNFLESIEETIFQHSDSPYKILLERAGYNFEDVRRSVEEMGIEGTLKVLCEKGVYIDILEFKGKKEVVRGKDVYRFQEKDFSNPLLTTGLKTRSGGTRGPGTTMMVPLEYIKEHNPYNVVAAAECGITKKPVIIWLPILPAGEGLFFNLRFTAMGNPPVKWFSQVDERYIRPSTIDRLKTLSSVWMARFYGKRMPGPEFVPIRDTNQIARWMNANLNGGTGFSIVTYASSALRLIMEAKRAGIDLAESVFWLMGEPLTDKISNELREYGCKAFSLYGCNELMIIGQGCARPSKSDDMHFCKDKLAVIQYPRKVAHADQSVDAFLFTTILKSSPKIFLNTETGDYGIIEKIHCGCGFEEIGFTEHIHTVRSFEKLTAEGATFIGSDLIPLVQHTLPQAFGGNATDYQFLEEADDEGIPRLFLLVSPEIGDIDHKKIKRMVYDALTSGEYSHTYSTSYWEQADTLRIKRMNPIPTLRGKIIPLHIRRK